MKRYRVATIVYDGKIKKGMVCRIGLDLGVSYI